MKVAGETMGHYPSTDTAMITEDPNVTTLRQACFTAFHEAGLSNDLLYAFLKCDFIVTDTNEHKHSAERIEQWNAALQEFEFLQMNGVDPLAKIRKQVGV
jgi:hypothetical protein